MSQFASWPRRALGVVFATLVCFQAGRSWLSASTNNLGVLALLRGIEGHPTELPTAVAWFERTLLLGPRGSTYRNLGLAQLAQGNLIGAAVALEASRLYHSDDLLTRWFYSGIALRQGDMEAAVELLVGGGVSSVPHSAFRQSGCKDDAGLPVADAVCLDRYGWQAWISGDLDHAELWFRAAMKANPDWGLPLLHLGEVFDARGDWAQSETAYREAIALGHDTADVRTRLGDVLLHLERSSEAEREYRRALLLNPAHSLMIYFQLSDIASQGGRVDEAEAWLLEARQQFPLSPWPLYYLAKFELRRGNQPEALTLLTEALRLAPDEPLIREVYEEVNR